MVTLERAAIERGEPRLAGRDTVVSFFYELSDLEGRLIECSALPETILMGHAQAAPSLEVALAGLSVGECRSVVLQPSDAFGLRSASSVLTVDRDEFPADVAPGDEFSAQGADGAHVFVSVLEVGPETVTIDTNHPLADQCVVLTVEVDTVRSASQGELLRAVSARGIAADAIDADTETDDGSRIIPLARLRGQAAAVPSSKRVSDLCFRREP